VNAGFPTRSRANTCTDVALRALTVGALAVSVLALGACDPLEPIDVGNAQIEVRLTDAAAAYVQEVNVDVGKVAIVPLGGSTIDLAAEGTASPVDLIRLHDQQPLQIALQDVEPGPYTQLQITLESASVVLDPDYAFKDGTTSRDLDVPAGAMALNLDLAGIVDDSVGSLIIPAGQLVLIVDLDVNQSVLIQGDPEAIDGIDDVIFDPKLRVVARAAAGSISGTVDVGVSGLSPSGLVVTARPLTLGVLGPYQTQAATALTDAEGRYTIPYLAGGRYAVNVDVPIGYTTDPGITEATLGTSGEVTGVDFQVIQDPGT